MRKFLILGLTFLLGSCAQKNPQHVCCGTTCFQVESATTPAAQERGLSFRKTLAPNNGMLFIFNQNGEQGFWMPHMNFPLDILWLDANKKIVFIAPNLAPCTPQNCPIVTPDKPARYVLEINAGLAAKNKMTIGTLCKFS